MKLLALLLALHTIPPHHSVKRIETASGLEDEDSLTHIARQYHIPPIVMWVICIFKESGIHGNNNARGPGFVISVRIDTIVKHRRVRKIVQDNVLVMTDSVPIIKSKTDTFFIRQTSIVKVDTIYWLAQHVTHLKPNMRRLCREIGRMQILPCQVEIVNGRLKIIPISWSGLSPHCRKEQVYNYSDNIRCGAAMLRYRYRKYGEWSTVIQHYNGDGDEARKYRDSAEQIIGRLILRMIKRYPRTMGIATDSIGSPK